MAPGQRLPKRRATTVLEKVVKKVKDAERRRKVRMPAAMQPELKSYNAAFNQTSVSSSTQYTLINAVSEGDDLTNRNGRRYQVTQLEYDYNVAISAANYATLEAAQAQPISGRVLIVYDSQTNGAAPTINTILDQGSGTGINIQSGHRNMSYSQRFKVLVDEKYVLNNGSGLNVRLTGIRKFAQPLPVQCIGTGAAVTDIGSGSIYLIYVDSNNSVANYSTIHGTHKINFYDV